MARSTAKFISYDLRPAKQSERRILIEILKVGGDCGLPIGDYRYVGMGANRFYDFLLIHRYLGVQKMISLEHDPDMFKRAVFNVPFGFIDVKPNSVAEFLAADTTAHPDIFWFDYDGGIGPNMLADIASMSTRAKVGDFCFVTVYGGPPRSLDRLSDEERHIQLKELLGDFAGEVRIEDVERAAFPTAVHKILMSAFQNGFATRREGQFVPLLQVRYTDSQPMVTVGGAFLTLGQGAAYAARLKATMPYVTAPKAKMYEIASFNLTERERGLFDRAVTASNGRSVERKTLKALGFKDAELAAYRDMVRYFPRYVETIV